MPPSRPKEKLKPPVPARSERPVMGLTTDRDYITANACEDRDVVAEMRVEG